MTHSRERGRRNRRVGAQAAFVLATALAMTSASAAMAGEAFPPLPMLVAPADGPPADPLGKAFRAFEEVARRALADHSRQAGDVSMTKSQATVREWVFGVPVPDAWVGHGETIAMGMLAFLAAVVTAALPWGGVTRAYRPPGSARE